MSPPTDLPTLLRFLTQDTKVPLATALSSVQALQKANLASIDSISKAKPEDLQAIFTEPKISKQILNAAKKRIGSSKKRGASNNVDDDNNGTKPSPPSPKKRRKEASSIFTLLPESSQSPAELESSLQLPQNNSSEPKDLADVVLFTNRAPLVLAFVVALLKYTMPEQPLSSRLSLAQAYVSMTSRARAVDLGIESGAGRTAEEEAGMGRASVVVLGREVRVLKRWGYNWGGGGGEVEETTHGDNGGDYEAQVKSEQQDDSELPLGEQEQEQEQSPALWGLDLEALSKSTSKAETSIPARARGAQSASTANLPIHTPQSARAYLLKSFDSPPSAAQPSKKKVTASAKAAEKERNLGMLLRALDLLYQSWIDTLGPAELDKRVWGWYVRVRPAVKQGVAGWGGKNEVKLADILALRREP
jgi:hypothetical protein